MRKFADLDLPKMVQKLSLNSFECISNTVKFRAVDKKNEGRRKWQFGGRLAALWTVELS